LITIILRYAFFLTLAWPASYSSDDAMPTASTIRSTRLPSYLAAGSPAKKHTVDY